MSHSPQGSGTSVGAKDQMVGAIQSTCPIPVGIHTDTRIRSAPSGDSLNRAGPPKLRNGYVSSIGTEKIHFQDRFVIECPR